MSAPPPPPADDELRSAIESAWQSVEAIERAYEQGALSRADWHARMAALVVPAYSAAPTPEAQSGFEGDAGAWERARRLVADAVDRPGRFLDIGCANGHLLQYVQAWCAERGLRLEVHGLEIAPALHALAHARLPHLPPHIHLGNAATWTPPTPYEHVRTGLEYVPRSERRALLEHLLTHTVAPGGQLLLGPYSHPHAEPDPLLTQLSAWNLAPERTLTRPHHSHPQLQRHLHVLRR